METLVAVVIVALTVTVFFQVLSGSMNLERRGRDKVRQVLALDRVFMEVQRLDIREPDFPWQGEDDGISWQVRVTPVDTADMRLDADELALTLVTELYLFSFEYVLPNGAAGEIRRFVAHAPDFFDDQFKAQRLPAVP